MHFTKQRRPSRASFVVCVWGWGAEVGGAGGLFSESESKTLSWGEVEAVVCCCGGDVGLNCGCEFDGCCW